VWNSNYKGVWHLEDATATTIADSTLNGNIGTKSGTVKPLETDGKISKAQVYDGTSSYINMGTGSSAKLISYDNQTFSFWVYPVGWGSSNRSILFNDSSSADGFTLWSSGSDLIYFGSAIGESNGYDLMPASDIQTNTWTNLVIVYSWNGSSVIVNTYKNGVADVVNRDTGEGRMVANNNFCIGGTSYSRYFNGTMDEVRVSSIARSAGWIKFEYNNVNSVGNELVWTGQEVSPEGPQNCATASGATICVVISSVTKTTQIDSFSSAPSTITASESVELSATLKYTSNQNPIAGQTIAFTDETASINVGTAITNASGVAVISYFTSLADSGTHILKAYYEGNDLLQTLPSEQTTNLLIESAGNCATSNDAVICVDILTEKIWLSGWSYRKQISISNTNIDSDLTDFPLYVKISADSDMSSALSNGYDIRFTDSDGTTLLPYERESWSGGNGTAATADFWVKVPNVYHSPTGTQNKIYVYYGNSIATDGQSTASVWDSNYKGVWHLKENGAPYADSTSNSINSTGGTAPTQATGVMSSAQSFNGTSQYISFGDKLDLAGSPLTLSAWVKASSWKNYDAVIDKLSAYGNYRFHINSGGVVIFGIRNSAGTYQSMSLGSLSTGEWHHITVTYDNATHGRLFIDGLYFGEKTNFSVTRADYSSSLNIGYATNNGVYYAGFIDETRISSGIRTDEWIKFEYYNQSSATNELNFYDEE
jgi:hypothetical protein